MQRFKSFLTEAVNYEEIFNSLESRTRDQGT
jgi:hypothetical protein